MGLILSLLFYDFFPPVTLPKIALQEMVEKPPRSFLKGILVLNLASLISIHFSPLSEENFLQSRRLWKTEPPHQQSQIYPDHLSLPVADDAKSRSTFS